MPGDCGVVEARLADAERPIDLLVNNAGFGTRSDFLAHLRRSTSSAELDVMVRAVLRLTRAALPGMIDRHAGGIVNVSSVAGWLPTGTYAAAKSWVTTFSQGIAKDLRGTGVTVLALCPGLTHTEFHERSGIDLSSTPDWLWSDVDTVVDAALRDLARGRRVSIPGAPNKALSALAQVVPGRVIGRRLRRPSCGTGLTAGAARHPGLDVRRARLDVLATSQGRAHGAGAARRRAR